MSLQDELLKLAQDIEMIGEQDDNEVILLHTKSHMYHNQKMHDKIVLEMNKRNINHFYFDSMDASNK